MRLPEKCLEWQAGAWVITQDNYVQSGVGVDEVSTNACMAAQGWQQATPPITGITPTVATTYSAG